jgi:hypothetical protein
LLEDPVLLAEAAQLPQLLTLLARQPLPPAAVDVGLAHPHPQRLGRDPEIDRDLSQ